MCLIDYIILFQTSAVYTPVHTKVPFLPRLLYLYMYMIVTLMVCPSISPTNAVLEFFMSGIPDRYYIYNITLFPNQTIGVFFLLIAFSGHFRD